MASITSRKRADGSTAHMAQIVIKRNGEIVHRENKTFNRKQAAYAWAHEREEELKAPGGLERLPNAKATLATAIDKYVDTSLREIGRTKAQVLRAIKSYPIADMLCSEIQSPDVIDLATELGKTRTPQTVANYLSHLGAVFAIARPAWGFPLNEQAVRDAFRVSKRLGLTGKSVQRDRRPSLDELDRLMQHFVDRKQRVPQAMPMHMVIAFSLFSTRRPRGNDKAPVVGLRREAQPYPCAGHEEPRREARKPRMVRFAGTGACSHTGDAAKERRDISLLHRRYQREFYTRVQGARHRGFAFP